MFEFLMEENNISGFTFLSFDNCTQIDFQKLNCFFKYSKKLKYVNIYIVNLTYREVLYESILSNNRIEEIDLSFQDQSKLYEKIIICLKSNKNLKTINLKKCYLKIRKDLIEAAASNSSLIDLNLERNDIDDSSFPLLKNHLDKIHIDKEMKEAIK